MQSDRSAGAHLWELGVVPRSACIISRGIGSSLYGCLEEFAYVREVRALFPFLLYYCQCCCVEEMFFFETGYI